MQVVSQRQEKANEYKIPLYFAVVDYEKAFHSNEFTSHYNTLENQGVDQAHITIFYLFNFFLMIIIYYIILYI